MFGFDPGMIGRRFRRRRNRHHGTMAITAEGFSYRGMKDAAETLRKKLYQVIGVAKVELFGVQDELVWLASF
jgi:multidrug efflux pump subunit AcrB